MAVQKALREQSTPHGPQVVTRATVYPALTLTSVRRMVTEKMQRDLPRFRTTPSDVLESW